MSKKNIWLLIITGIAMIAAFYWLIHLAVEYNNATTLLYTRTPNLCMQSRGWGVLYGNHSVLLPFFFIPGRGMYKISCTYAQLRECMYSSGSVHTDRFCMYIASIKIIIDGKAKKTSTERLLILSETI